MLGLSLLERELVLSACSRYWCYYAQRWLVPKQFRLYMLQRSDPANSLWICRPLHWPDAISIYAHCMQKATCLDSIQTSVWSVVGDGIFDFISYIVKLSEWSHWERAFSDYSLGLIRLNIQGKLHRWQAVHIQWMKARQVLRTVGEMLTHCSNQTVGHWPRHCSRD